MKRIVTALTIFLASLTTVSIGQTYKDAYTSFVPASPNQLYFPLAKSPDASDALEQFVNMWYSQQLFALREPVIFNETTQNEIYRFTWLRSFHHPIVVRIERQGDRYSLFWKMGDGQGGYSPGKLIVNKQINIDKATWDKFKMSLDQSKFWDLQIQEGRGFGSDEAEWVLEGKTNGKYHIVDRWSPKKDGNYYQCCNLLIELTDINIKSRDKY